MGVVHKSEDVSPSPGDHFAPCLPISLGCIYGQPSSWCGFSPLFSYQKYRNSLSSKRRMWSIAVNKSNGILRSLVSGQPRFRCEAALARL
ncbi:hypothetical protein Avbf_06363 [Armadillidium vulgare]|nr:hypothetical protein Avbf_06363 [Armadillidium vulgare]